MERLPSYRDFTPLLGMMSLPAIPYSSSFELHAKRIPSPPTASDAQSRRDNVKVPGGWHCLTLRCSRVQSICRSGTVSLGIQVDAKTSDSLFKWGSNLL